MTPASVSQRDDELSRQSLRQALVNAWDELSLLYRLGEKLSRLTDEDEIAAVAVREAVDVLHADCGWAVLWEGETLRVPRDCHVTIDTAVVDEVNRIVLGTLRSRGKRQLLLHSVNEECSSCGPNAPVRLLVSAIVKAGSDGGFVCLGRGRDRQIFTSADQKLLDAVTTFTSMELETVRLHRSELGKQQLVHELEMARQVQLAENAATIGRFAAALSHEINTPLGSLKSSVSTLRSAVVRYASVPDERKQSVLQLIEELGDAANESLSRLAETVRRMQCLTNLDRAEGLLFKLVDLNDLLRDVASSLGVRGQERVSFDLTLQRLPPVICMPQQLAAVFFDLINEVIEAAEQKGQVRVSTADRAGRVEMLIQCNGPAISASDIDSFFDPRFQVSDNRVVTGNWSFFNCKKAIQEHGGEIKVSSTEEWGTEIRITLPCQTGWTKADLPTNV